MAEYEIMYDGSFPIIRYRLGRGERLKAESGAMIAMSSTIDVEGGIEGGLLKGIGRLFSGAKFFFQYLSAARGAGAVLLGHSIPGGIIDVDLDGSYELRVQKDGFLAATEGVEIDTKAQNLTKGLFSGEGFFILNISGKGTVSLSSYGSIHPVNLQESEEIVIDNGHLVAWPAYMDYTIEKASSGWISSFTSGEGLVCKFRGPGTVLIQTRNPSAFKDWCVRLGLGSSGK